MQAWRYANGGVTRTDTVEQLLVGLNNDSNKLKKTPKEARGDPLRQLLRQV